MTPTPKPPIEAMAQSVSERVFSLAGASLHMEIAECVILAALRAAEAEGWCLVPKALVEEAADALEWFATEPVAEGDAIAARLRAAAANGGAT